MLGLDRPAVKRRLDELTGQRGLKEHAATVLRHPVDTMRMMGALLENGTRLGEAAAVERKTLAANKTPKAAATEATLAARDVSIDFAQAGTATRAANQVVAFFNAWVRGQAQMMRELTGPRKGIILGRALAMITAPSIVLLLMQDDDPVYQEIPAWRKDVSWVYVQRGTDKGEGWDGHGTGKVEHIWYVPKPFELGILFGTIPERVVRWVMEQDPEQGRAIVQAFRRGFMPPVLPNAIVPLVENWANRSTWRDRPIVPRNRENLDPAQQYNERTGEAARTVGGALGYSPAKIENVVQGWFGGLGKYGLSAADLAVRGVRAIAGEQPLRREDPTQPEQDPLSRVPGLRGVVGRVPTFDAESVERTYREFQIAERRRQTWMRFQKEGRAAEADAYYQDHAEAIASVATREMGGPGALRAAYEALQAQRLQRRRAAGLEITPARSGRPERPSGLSRPQRPH
jgi:hypothetical protein